MIPDLSTLAGPTGRLLAPGVALVHADARRWLASLPDRSVHAVVTDPPYGLVEYEEADHDKLRGGRGGVWRIPPTLDGVQRAPVPRFTVLGPREIEALRGFFDTMAWEWLRVLVPGGHVFLASNPLLSTGTFAAMAHAGFEKRGEIIRLVTTLRGGDRPKGAHAEFADVSVMPRAGWEPWGLFRKPLEGTVAENLRRWGTGGLRRRSEDEPFRDVIPCAPARGLERTIAPHPSLKPQRFLRQIVRAALPLGTGIVLDPFAGSGSTLAAAAALGVSALGVERDAAYVELAATAVPRLAALRVR
ncbi:MAG: DNA methyltransferase [Pseudomonadota bacterium]|nr:DNA methyltransferase [Pseudomonadota bacterium]